MATQSIIAAALTKFDGLTASGFPSSTRPKIYFDEAPQTDASGDQIRAESGSGYCVLKDKGQDVKIVSFNLETREVASFDIEIYYTSLADCDTAALAIKRNGGTTAQKLGFDFGTLSDLASPRGTFVVKRAREQRGKAGVGRDGKPVHFCRLSYRVEILEDA
jgi:hypothetical protein